MLGPGGKEIASSGDEVADAATRESFVAAYDEKHAITMDGENKAIMVVGSLDFPVPIPIVRKEGMWRFDTAAAREEILDRRIGRNELNAIQVCLAYVDAQDEYAEKDRTGAGINTYAQRIVSRPGKNDCLYWQTSQGEEASPLGELFAQATAEGYRAGEGRTPYQGYFFKILTKQGPAAPGGELGYIVRDKMIGGFALVAYPAEYRNSGVMTFIVNHAGTVFQKDLGPRTSIIADYDIKGISSRRDRPDYEQQILENRYRDIRVLELSGALSFANTDYVLRAVSTHERPDILIFDLRRVPSVTEGAASLLVSTLSIVALIAPQWVWPMTTTSVVPKRSAANSTLPIWDGATMFPATRMTNRSPKP